DVKGVRISELVDQDRRWERVHLVFDPEHRHVTFRHFMAAGDGARNAWQEEATGIQTLCKHLATENWREWRSLGTTGWKADLNPTAHGYVAESTLPRAALGLVENEPTIGFNVWVEGRSPHYEQVFLSPPGRRLPADPMTFADLYLTPPPAVVEEIDLGIP